MIAKTSKLTKVLFTPEFFASLAIFEAFVGVSVYEIDSNLQTSTLRRSSALAQRTAVQVGDWRTMRLMDARRYRRSTRTATTPSCHLIFLPSALDLGVYEMGTSRIV